MFSLRRVTLEAARNLKPSRLNRFQRVTCIYVDSKRDCSTISRRSFLIQNTFLVQTPHRFQSTVVEPPVSPNLQEAPATPRVEDSAEIESEINVTPEPVVLTQPIPDPPVPPVEEAIIETLVNGEPTFESLGLGGWTPVGMIQNCFEFFHLSCGLPWWVTIAMGTACVRIIIFPLVIIAQRNAAKMHNNLPQMQVLQMKMSDARERGDRLDAARYAQEMMTFMKEKGMNPFKNMIVPFAQAPIFISFFMGLREMCNLPVESLKDGGILWFTDLTVPDQFYLLPLITSATLALTIEIGTDAARLNSANLGMMKYVFRAMPLVIFPFTLNFSGGVLVYWASSNLISLCQVAFLRIPRVRDFFKIEKLQKFDPKDLPIKDKGFKKGLSESWTNMKITRELEERQRIDEINFMRAGRGAVKKTYKTDPTKLPRSIPTIQAKKRD